MRSKGRTGISSGNDCGLPPLSPPDRTEPIHLSGVARGLACRTRRPSRSPTIATRSCTPGNLRRDDVLDQGTADDKGALPGRAPLDRSAERSFEPARDRVSGQTWKRTACAAATKTKRPKANDLLSANLERWRLESDIAVDRP